jgi:hypothetical protein
MDTKPKTEARNSTQHSKAREEKPTLAARRRRRSRENRKGEGSEITEMKTETIIFLLLKIVFKILPKFRVK